METSQGQARLTLVVLCAGYTCLALAEAQL